MTKLNIFLLLFFNVLIGFILPGKINADEGGGWPPPPTCPGGKVWDEYQCNSTCNADILKRRVWEWYTLESFSGVDCPSFSCQYHIFRDPWSKTGSCQSWQACGPQGVIKDKSPSCSCSGQCLEAPQNPKYYDNPNSSNQPDKDKGTSNLLLPVKFDWDDVAGWLASPDGPKSYIFKFQNAISKILNKSEYSELREEKGACFLKSNSDYSWQAQACCSADGRDCGPAGNFPFKTSLAPEIVSPEDPDWAGPKGGTAVITPDSPLKIDWCDVPEAKSYRFRVFFEDEKTQQRACAPILHNPFIAGDQCESWLADKERRNPDQIEKLLYSDFTDSDLVFFTKDTTYDWEVKICLDEYGGGEGECKDFSQRWSFTSEQKAFKELTLLSPSDDPGGETPVGLPVILDWSAPSGMNSFMYQLNGIISYTTQSSQSKALDIPDLSINRIYKWRVKACSDYQAIECEEFSPERTFKTTGQPPILENPASGASAVPIPINLNWREVPGADSYILNISGSGLSFEKTLKEPGISLGYPEYSVSQENEFSWQVKTCAHDGWACGPFASARTFTTFRLARPSKPSPENNGQLSTNQKSISWQEVPGTKAYQYKIKYITLSSDEKNESCKTSVGEETVPSKTIPTNSDFVELNCLGQYQWQTKACLDENCTETSNWSDWTFSLKEPGAIDKGGLVPCGREVDNPKTAWNDREPCQIRHAFLLIKILIDFIFLRLIPTVLVLLTIATGVMFYFSMGGRVLPILNIKRLWKSVGIAFLIAMFAWTMINLVLKLIGYQVGIFGNWYEIIK